MYRIIFRKERTALGSNAWRGDLASAKAQCQEDLTLRHMQDGATSVELVDGDTQKVVYSCTVGATRTPT